MNRHRSRVTDWLDRASVTRFAVYAVGCSFTAYFCMYGFRKPFTVGAYEGVEFGNFELKNALVIAQLIGYALSKFVGIKVNSELWHRQRLPALVCLVIWAEVALLFFAIAPPWGKIVAIFVNGVPLGMIWGIVFSYLEGRRSSEILGAGLSCSYIVASGVVKSTGKGFLEYGVSEDWMPALTGAVFLPGFIIASIGLNLLPAPKEQDVAVRSLRTPMDRSQRYAFIRQYWPGLSLLMIVYIALTAYRDFRDNYAAEIWAELELGSSAAVFTVTEVPVAISVMVVLGLLYLIRNNRKGLAAVYMVMFLGGVIVGICTLLFDAGWLSPAQWMTGVGLGVYMAYVPYGCVLFDRTIAALRTTATAVFLIYVSDAAAYGGTVVAVLYKELGQSQTSWLNYFRMFSYVTCGTVVFCLVGSYYYFLQRVPRS